MGASLTPYILPLIWNILQATLGLFNGGSRMLGVVILYWPQFNPFPVPHEAATALTT